MTSPTTGPSARLFRPGPASQQEQGTPIAVILPGQVAGRSADAAAKLLASDGVRAIAVEYFPREGGHCGLVAVDVVHVARTIRAAIASNRLLRTPVVLVGHSRGCELAFLLAAHLDHVVGIAAASPSAVVNAAMRSVHMSFDEAAWLVDGEPIPYFRGRYRFREYVRFFGTRRLVQSGRFRGWSRTTASRIPVPVGSCQVLLQYGDDDHFWPSAAFVKQMADDRTEVRRYRRCGHLGLFPGVLPGDEPPATVAESMATHVDFGGSPGASREAARESYRVVLNFVRSLR
ncbi:alpha/beta fold hydrolase [Microbacterium trichothecenolyticum]|uniref:Pimeloyl-ACP methyl ester carboxylesterase n=1 Tax=Microbacterium trichothecenolyticum TaxID=69370 RepID=A0ABU0TUM1_MICTR|nr:pimeloyl-ACP methyl ester carboxylesterase [Microbacterium trichothecenolyticum]